MRRITIATMSALTGVSLLFGYHMSLASQTVPIAAAGPAPTPSGLPAIATARATSKPLAKKPRATSRNRSSARATSTASTRPQPVSSPTASLPAATVSAAPSGTFTGSAVQTQWGIVQVQITVTNGKIVSVAALQSPNSNGHSLDVNNYALPQLQVEAVAANSAQINAISGATVTSGGYIQSLQSAIDQAHL